MPAKTITSLKREVEKAEKEGLIIIKIEGLSFNVRYARYLLRYFEAKGIPDSTRLSEVLE
jgi:hypothetical protein